jgi:HNH endonuclease/AP2 domain
MSLTLEKAERFLRADFATGELFWKFHYQRPDLVGKRAGAKNNGYWRLALDGTQYYACQIIWLMYYGELPDKIPDHIDMVRDNDSISNLRLATRAQNVANSKMNVRNTSGYRGVSWCAVMGQWQATIRIDGHSKKIGYYDDPAIAHKAYIAVASTARGAEFVRA